MAITDVRLSTNDGPFIEQASQTMGNEYVFQVPSDCKIFYFAEPTAAGAANLALHPAVQGSAITAHTNFDQEFTSNISTRFSGEIAAGAVSHIGLDIASGTWRLRLKFVKEKV